MTKVVVPPRMSALRGSTQASGLPEWVVPASLSLSVLGLALSIYLTIEHYTAPGTAACPAGRTVNCAQVTTSAQSMVFGVPVAVLGVVFFVAALALCLPQVWAMRDPRVWKARLGVTAVGLAFALYLIFTEIFVIDAICLWCTAVHVVTFGLFAVVAMATALADLPSR